MMDAVLYWIISPVRLLERRHRSIVKWFHVARILDSTKQRMPSLHFDEQRFNAGLLTNKTPCVNETSKRLYMFIDRAKICSICPRWH